MRVSRCADACMCASTRNVAGTALPASRSDWPVRLAGASRGLGCGGWCRLWPRLWTGPVRTPTGHGLGLNFSHTLHALIKPKHSYPPLRNSCMHLSTPLDSHIPLFASHSFTCPFYTPIPAGLDLRPPPPHPYTVYDIWLSTHTHTSSISQHVNIYSANNKLPLVLLLECFFELEMARDCSNIFGYLWPFSRHALNGSSFNKNTKYESV